LTPTYGEARGPRSRFNLTNPQNHFEKNLSPRAATRS
jgi:hypothetical protein